jgi:hypothetical protein
VGGGKTTVVRTTVVQIHRRRRKSNPNPVAGNILLWDYSQQCNICHSSTPALQEGFFIFLLIDGNQDDLHVFQQQDIPIKVCTPLGFNYNTNIDGSIATLVESCNLLNIHKLKHGDVPATHNAGSFEFFFGFLS